MPIPIAAAALLGLRVVGTGRFLRFVPGRAGRVGRALTQVHSGYVQRTGGSGLRGIATRTSIRTGLLAAQYADESEMEAALNEAIQLTLQDGYEVMRDRVPVVTGNLRRSIRIEDNGIAVYAPYARPVERRTPYFRPGVQQMRKTLPGHIRATTGLSPRRVRASVQVRQGPFPPFRDREAPP